MAGLKVRLTPRTGLLSGWAGLGRFWLAVLAVLGLTAGVVQTFGPRETPAGQAVAAKPAPVPSEQPAPGKTAMAEAGHKAGFSPQSPGRAVPGPISDPDPALLEPVGGTPPAFLPRISTDGRAPMHEYAAGFDLTSRRPRVGIIIAGIGMSEADSLSAIRHLPRGVTLAVSPYADNIDRLLAAARLAEQEYLLAIPMEPQEFPVNDPDDRHALMTSLTLQENQTRLDWVLSRITGYVGVTNALGPMHGERLSGQDEQFSQVLEDVAARGLLFVDARPGQPVLKYAWNRGVDLVIDDDPVDEASLDSRLDALTKLAKDKGSALGLVSIPRPVTLDRVAAWTNTLNDKGLVLAPVSALAVPPAKQDEEPGK